MRSFTLLITLVATVLLWGCQKETSIDSTNKPDAPATGVNGVIKARIDGVQWTANLWSVASRMGGLITIGGRSKDQKTFAITLVDSGVHRYTLDQEAFPGAGVWIDSTEADPLPYTTHQTDDASLSGGVVTITSINTEKKTMSGTFSFNVYRFDTEKTIKITEGSFTDVKYTTNMPAAALSDTFRVKIDGAAWTPASITGISVPTMSTIGITASDNQGVKAVGLSLPMNVKTGTYTLGASGNNYLAQYNPDEDPMHVKTSESGTLTILEHNTSTKRIRGTFAFKGAEIIDPDNTAELTEGYFSVKYQ